MANINLNNHFKKKSDIKSPVDSRIQLNKAETDKLLWGDIRLDLKCNEIKLRPLNAKLSTKDLQKIVNELSVIVALRNIFNTHGCSRLLNPLMSFELGTYLFLPLTQEKAWFLGYDIYQQLPKWLPRVRISNVNVIADIKNDCYVILLTVSIPNVSGETFKVSSILSATGYSIN